VMFLGAVGLVYIALSHPLIVLFAPDVAVAHYGTQALWIVSLAFPLYAAGMCLEAAFNGAGDTWTPTRLNFFCLWLGQVPIAWVLAHPLGLGAMGVFIAVPVSFTILTLWSAILFRGGRWKERKL
jgi:Na+-driven multidrug efflux pump